MKLFNPTLYWLICGVYSDFHVIKISFATKIAHTFLETKKNFFSLFSLSQLVILTKSWLVYHFPKYFQKEWLNTLEDLFVCVCHKNVTDVSASGRTWPPVYRGHWKVCQCREGWESTPCSEQWLDTQPWVISCQKFPWSHFLGRMELCFLPS